MINWISSEEEKSVRKINYDNLKKIITFAKKSKNEMVLYACEIFDEYRDLINRSVNLIKENISQNYKSEFIIDGSIKDSDIILSPSDANAYYTIKELNSDKKDLTVLCFDMHSDTYDYNDFLWKGNSFSKLMNEGYVTHYVVIGVPINKRQEVLNETNPELISRVHLIDEEELIDKLNCIDPKNIFVSVDADCFNSRKARYTAIEYSPATILNNISHIKNVDKTNIDKQICDCIHVKNELGYSNYYQTGEKNLTVEKVIEIIQEVIQYCNQQRINIGLFEDSPFLQIMEISGYDYGDLTSEMVVKLINKFRREAM